MIISAYLGVTGLVDVGYRFYTSAEVAVAARVTTGIVDAGNGWYSVDAAIPSTGVSVRWDSTGTSTAVAREYFDITVKLDTALELDGTVYRYTVNALENAPVGGGGATDWTSTERDQIRYRLGLDGSFSAPPIHPIWPAATVAAIKTKTDNLPADPADASDIATSFTTVNTKLMRSMISWTRKSAR
jgi:hypothetical protein